MIQILHASKLFSIAPDANFLKTLVEAIVEGELLGDWDKTNPFWLADVTIILPTRRARLALSTEFANKLGGAALLPDIRTLGVEEDEERAFLSGIDQEQPLSGVADFDRRFLLCTLVEKWLQQNKLPELLAGNEVDKNGGGNSAKILGLADSLAQLIDELIIEGVSAKALRQVPDLELGKQRNEDLAANFASNLEFLEIALSAWPEILLQRRQVDASAKRVDMAARQAQNLSKIFGERPVIAAGSTGSVAATANLLLAITGLERGCLVLPGLNTGLSEQSHNDLLEIANSAHGHPQYGLSQLLNRLGALPSMVKELAKNPNSPRTNLTRSALVLARDTAHWSDLRAAIPAKEIFEATRGISLMEANTEQEQALSVALAARQALQYKQSVGIITPDRNFARRVASELKRFDIEVDDSAGTPLFHSKAGRLIRQILGAAQNNFAPVELMALLRNTNFAMGQNRADILATGDLLEFALLRGQRAMPGIGGLREVLRKNLAGELLHTAHRLSTKEGEAIARLFDLLEMAFLPLVNLLQKTTFDAAQLASALWATFGAVIKLSAEKLPQLNGLRELDFWQQKLQQCDVKSPRFSSVSLAAILQSLMQNFAVRSSISSPATDVETANISIWGQLEARLQSADLMIICTLNEGIWPGVADPGPWLSRSMRLNCGLQPPERQHGLAAHDFEMAMGNENVILALSKRIGKTPALPSRLVERFCGFAQKEACDEMRRRGKKWLDMASLIDKTSTVMPAIRPAPSPDAKLRPKSISITEVETLIRSPYDLYAKYVLGLRAIDPLGEEIGHRERGTLVHEVFGRFVAQNHDPRAKNATEILEKIAIEVFAVLDGQPDQRDIWLRRLRKSSEGFLEFERLRAKEIKQRYAEKNLELIAPAGAIKLKLHGRADRIDIRNDGSVEILDFKTGSVPVKTAMVEFMAPQMLIEAAIVKAAGFEDCSPATVNALTYIKIASGPNAFELNQFEIAKGENIDGMAARMLEMVLLRADAFLGSDNVIMSPRIMPAKSQRFAGRYDHLARTAEWTLVDDAIGSGGA